MPRITKTDSKRVRNMSQTFPEHIKNMRDSIVAEVVKGRSVNETIALMRTIFG